LTFFNAIYEIGIIKEFSVTTSSVQTSAYLFFAFLHIFLGIGSYIAYRFFPVLIKNIKYILCLLSLSILLSLFFNLRLSVVSIISLATSILSVCLAFGFFGLIYGLVIIYFTRNKSRYVGALLLSVNLGLIIGFILEPYLAVHVGVNAVCFILGVSFLFLSRIPFYYFFFLVFILMNLSSLMHLDKNIESLRLKRNIVFYNQIGLDYQIKDYEEIFNGWSPYTKLNIFRHPNKNKIMGAYNYRILWYNEKDITAWERLPFQFIGEKDKILDIGSAAGRDAYRLPSNRILSKENTVLVEIDPLMVQYFKNEHPEYNDNLFNIVNVIAADGRSVLDEMREKKDVIIIGTLKSSATNIWMLNELKNYMFTIESLKRCFEILNPKGVLVIYQPKGRLFFANIFCSSLKKLGVYFRIFNIRFFPGDNTGRYFIYASKSQSKVDQIASQLSVLSARELSMYIDESVILTDDRPFINLIGPYRRQILKTLSNILICIFLLLSILLSFINYERKEKLFYFFLIGNGFFLLQLTMLSKFRSFFSHPIKTIIIVNAIFLFSVGIGNILSHRINIGMLKEKIWFHVFTVGLVLLLFYFSITHIPFSISNYYLKILVSLFAILPIGILCGLYYPIGLLVNKNRNLGYALLFDGIGACSAFIVFYFICGLFGILFNIYVILFTYILAALLISA
jgi:spermidine synthase